MDVCLQLPAVGSPMGGIITNRLYVYSLHTCWI